MSQYRKLPLRDVLTGERIIPKSQEPVMIVREFNPTRIEQPIFFTPRVMHVRRPEAGKGTSSLRMGSNSWHPEFRKYIGDIGLTSSSRKRKIIANQWYAVPEVERTLYAYFQRGIVEAVLMVLRDGRSWQTAATSCELSISRLRKYCRKMENRCKPIVEAYINHAV